MMSQEPREEAPLKLPANPSDPTPEERELHSKTHVPHKSCCSVCVQVFGREDKHYSLRKPHKRRRLVGRDRWASATTPLPKLIVKTDGEPALVNMQEAVAQKRLHETLIKNPPAYDPQANEGLKGRSQRSKHRCAPYKLAWSRDSACQWIQDRQSSSG